jgi:hypothetical protein
MKAVINGKYYAEQGMRTIYLDRFDEGSVEEETRKILT